MLRRSRFALLLAVVTAIAVVTVGHEPHTATAASNRIASASLPASGAHPTGGFRLRATPARQEVGVVDLRGERSPETGSAGYARAVIQPSVTHEHPYRITTAGTSAARSRVGRSGAGPRAPPRGFSI